jgi:hypothetical protein
MGVGGVGLQRVVKVDLEGVVDVEIL